jgi:hypothetical protein
MLAAFLLACSGGVGLYVLITSTIPKLGPRWLFYFLLTGAATGLSLPFLWLLNGRFRTKNPAPPPVLLREALFFGLYASTCLWLQSNGMLTLMLALLLGLGLIAVEWLLRVIERSIWRPGG